MAGIDNLKPIRPGEVRNPKGINGFTYRDDAEKALARWCKEHGDELIERLLEDARKGKGYAMKLALDRILPAVQQHELTVVDEPDIAAAVDRFFAGTADEVPRESRGNGSNGSGSAL